MEPKAELDNLPGSDDKEFWEQADVHTSLTPKVMFDSTHYFVRVAGHQAQCNHCNWGFQLEPGDKIVDGHLVDKDGKRVL